MNNNINISAIKTSVFSYLASEITEATKNNNYPDRLCYVFFGTIERIPDKEIHRKYVFRYPSINNFHIINKEQADAISRYLEIDCSPFAHPNESPAINKCNKQKVDKQLSTYIRSKAALSVSSAYGRRHLTSVGFICFGDIHKNTKDEYKTPNLGSVEYITDKQQKEILTYLSKPEEPSNGYIPFMTITVRPDDDFYKGCGTLVRPDPPYYVIHCGLTTRYIYCGDSHRDTCSFESRYDDEYYPEYY